MKDKLFHYEQLFQCNRHSIHVQNLQFVRYVIDIANPLFVKVDPPSVEKKLNMYLY